MQGRLQCVYAVFVLSILLLAPISGHARIIETERSFSVSEFDAESASRLSLKGAAHFQTCAMVADAAADPGLPRLSDVLSGEATIDTRVRADYKNPRQSVSRNLSRSVFEEVRAL